MRPKIIAVDYDGTLEVNGKMNAGLIESLVREQSAGSIVILWTCREGKSLMQAVETLARHGLAPNYVNRNCPQAMGAIGHDSRKVFADVYIDDKNMQIRR